MDERAAPSGQSDNKDFFEPEGVVTSDGVSAEAGPAPQKPQESAPQQVQRRRSEPASSQSAAVAWTASEFIAHNKSLSWYMILAAVAVALAATIWLLTKDIFSTAVVLAGAMLLGVYAAHKPRQLTYQLDDRGLTIGGRQYAFAEFRSFSLVPEGAFASIELMPLKRFAMYTTIYFDPADEEKIIDVLSAHLPMEEPRGDTVDQLMRRIRF